jgi:DNA-binding beta-propeller fold protein YncE
MKPRLAIVTLVILALAAPVSMLAQQPEAVPPERLEALKKALAAAARLPLSAKPFPFVKPATDWEVGIVSCVRMDSNGDIYVLHRGLKADPVLVFNSEGHLLRSWGKGLFTTPHGLRIDPDGNIWTVDGGSSMVFKFTKEGKKLLEIPVGGIPDSPDCKGGLCGATDIAFGPNGRIFISDGYRNARVLEYTSDGRKVREWGSAGRGPGQFNLVHGIVYANGTLFVADRENNRVQKFGLDGSFLGEWTNVGKAYSLAFRDGTMYVGAGILSQTSSSQGQRPPGWLLKIDVANGKILAYVDSDRAHHFIEVTPAGELMGGSTPEGFFWFRK